MAAKPQSGSSASGEAALPLLSDTIDGAVDFQGRPSVRSSSGGWRAASFIIGVEVAERLAYYGILSNLISYLTGPLGQSTAVAAENVNAWSGTGSLSPLLGAFVADMFLGCYRTIVVASTVYIVGLGLLTFSAVLPSLCPFNGSSMPGLSSCSPSIPKEVLFFFSLYLIAFAKGGHKPCVQAFGADQFDGHNPEECKAKSSFFNWWYFWLSAGPLVVLFFLNYIQDNLSWGLGFGIPCISMAVALVIFLLGSRTYRYSVKGDENSPFLRIASVFILAFKNRKTTSSALALEEESRGILPNEASMQFKFLNKALLSPDGSKADGNVCSLAEVEEAKSVLRLIPIWLTSLVYAVVFSQPSTFFTKQGVTMDRVISPGFNVPPASLQSFISLAVVLFIPIYDRIFVPLMRAFTRQPSGITMLQRIGIGIFLCGVSMVIAALVEKKRLEIAREHGLVDLPDVTVPMSVWWLIPQYALFGISEVFAMVGLQEFFYDQVPAELRSMGLSLYISLFGVGNFLSSFIVSAIEKATGGEGKYSWFASNLNRAHLHYFYWLLAGLSALELMVFLYFSRSYIYNRSRTI